MFNQLILSITIQSDFKKSDLCFSIIPLSNCCSNSLYVVIVMFSFFIII